jgi:hypothetical protein
VTISKTKPACTCPAVCRGLLFFKTPPPSHVSRKWYNGQAVGCPFYSFDSPVNEDVLPNIIKQANDVSVDPFTSICSRSWRNPHPPPLPRVVCRGLDTAGLRPCPSTPPPTTIRTPLHPAFAIRNSQSSPSPSSRAPMPIRRPTTTRQ